MEYAYLLGMYLGDGVISRARREVYRLRISTDARYPGVIGDTVAAIEQVLPASSVSVHYSTHRRLAVVSSYSRAWPCLIPQHGPGPKHARRIELEPWQEAIVERHGERFLRGLIHSDGCRVINRVAGREYPRYFFTQVSADIRQLFCMTCEQLGIEFTLSSWKNVSIARRASVANLDGFVGPKS